MVGPHRVFMITLSIALTACGGRTPAPTASVEPAVASPPAPRMRIGIPRELRPTEEGPTPTEPTQADPTPTEPTPAEPTPAEPTPTYPTPTEPPPAEPPPAEPPPAEAPAAPAQNESAGWVYLRDARRHVAHTYREQIQACFNEGGARSGPLSGRLVVAMVPHEDGRVASSRVIENETADSELGECVVQAARGWELPPPPRRTLEVQLRFAI
ncbi:MAG: AgmX/PglI C-terminal domain-containing protein [Sandaracinaceae bacterium]